MIVYRQDTSFPFMKIANDFGVKYERVLQAVEAINAGKPPMLPPHILPALRVAMLGEEMRRAKVAGHV